MKHFQLTYQKKKLLDRGIYEPTSADKSRQVVQ